MDPLNALHDISESASAHWWPLAWGWWLVAALILIALSVVIFMLLNRRKRLAPARAAQAMMKQQEFKSLAEINTVAKRYALVYATRADIASLSGEQWLDYMISTMPEAKRVAFSENLAPFRSQFYKPADSHQIQLYTELVATWLEDSHV